MKRNTSKWKILPIYYTSKTLIMKAKFLILILILITLLNCNLKTNTEVIKLTSQYSIKDLVESKLELYQINENASPLLDSIIRNINECVKYRNTQIGFVFTVYKDTTNKTIISIENTTNLYKFDYSRCNGVFYYKGYQFVNIGIINDSLLKDLGQRVQLYSVNKEKLRYMYKGSDEFFHSSWSYIYDGEDFKCVDFNVCGKFWSINNPR
jgi:competence protein ComGC